MDMGKIVDDALFGDDKDSVSLLESTNLDKASEEELRELLKHLRSQFKTRYKYLVGEWGHAHRAKNTRNGQFVSVKEVVDYLEE